MTLRIGDLLLQQGVITQAELEEALKYQVIFGGKLGTNLIEMGVLEEEDITNALSRKFKVPAVDRDEILRIAPETIAAIPAALAEKYRVLPLLLEGRRLTLAMADPANLKAVDEISFRTGLIIRPRVVAEVRLLLALEKYYGIERDRRYIHTARKIEVKKKKHPPTPPPPATTALPDLAPEETWEIPLPKTEKLEGGNAVLAGLPPAPQAAEEEELLELDEVDVHEAAPEEGAAGKVEALAEEQAAEMLVEAEDRDEILAAVLGSLAHDFPRCAIFLVRGELAMGWMCAVERQTTPGFDQLQIPLAEPSVLKTVAEGKSYYLGPIPRSPFNSMILQEMGGTVPAAALLVPLLMMGRVVGILYADGRGVDLGEKLFELQKLTAKAAMAFEILVLKNKILSL
jgi:hypothetical protein